MRTFDFPFQAMEEEQDLSGGAEFDRLSPVKNLPESYPVLCLFSNLFFGPIPPPAELDKELAS
jgi:hypothetical protein